MACAVWEEDAPGLFAWTEDDSPHGKIPHCYVARQPRPTLNSSRSLPWRKTIQIGNTRSRPTKGFQLCLRRLGMGARKQDG